VVLDGAYRDEDLSRGHLGCAARQSGGSAGTTVGRANIDGTGAPNNLFVTGATFSIGVATPSGIAVDGTYVYWANQPTSGVYGSIGRALHGGGATQSFVSNVFYPVGLDVDPPAASPPGPGPGPTTPGPSTPGPGPVPIGVDPPSPDLVAASTPSCLSIPSVVRDQKSNVPGGKVFLVTRQLADPAAPLRVSVKGSGAARVRSASFRVNRGRSQGAGPAGGWC
jgi:hypothetical protein